MHIHFVEAEAIEQRGDTGPGVLPRFVKDAVGERGLGDLLFGCQANLGFQVWIGGNQQTRCAGIDPRLSVIDPCGENLRRRQAHLDGISMHGSVVRLELAQIYPGDYLSVRNQQQLVAHQKVGKVSALAFAAHDLIERINHRFQTGKLTDFFNHRRRGKLDAGAAACDVTGELVPQPGLSEVSKSGQQQDAEYSPKDKCTQRESVPAGLNAPGMGWR